MKVPTERGEITKKIKRGYMEELEWGWLQMIASLNIWAYQTPFLKKSSGLSVVLKCSID